MDEKPKRPKVKITVLRRECYQDLQESYLLNPKAGPCNLFRDGQEFIVDLRNFNRMLDGSVPRLGIASAAMFMPPCRVARSCGAGQMMSG